MRTLELYASLAVAGLRAEVQYRLNFLVWVLMGMVYQGTGFVFLWILLARFQVLAGWTLGEVGFLYGLRLLAHGLTLLLFGYIFRLEYLVREGQFDRYLVRPVPALVQTITHRFPVGAVGDFLGGLAIFVAAARLVSIDWSPPALVYLGLAIVGACLIEGSLKVAIAALTFRLLSSARLAYLADDIFSLFGNYPLKLFDAPVQAVLAFGLPVAFVAYFPATVLLSRTDELSVHPVVAYLAPCAGLVWFSFARWLWRHELRQYQSVGH
jgi:ABC-2 type transport system permease protein